MSAGSSSEPFRSARADKREKKRGVCAGDPGGFQKLFMALYYLENNNNKKKHSPVHQTSS